MHNRTSKIMVLAVALTLTGGGAAGVGLLGQRADSSRLAQLDISALRLSLADLQTAPFNADPTVGGSPSAVRVEIQLDERSISNGLKARAQAGVPLGLLRVGRADFAAIQPVVTSIYQVAVRGRFAAVKGAPNIPAIKGAPNINAINGAPSTNAIKRAPNINGDLQRTLAVRSARLTAVFGKIGAADAARAALDRTEATVGAAVAMLLLLVAFAFFYLRSAAAQAAVEELARENKALLGVSRVEARTDALTTLGNRRALASKLAAAMQEPSTSVELLLIILDLDGFKQYNDTFGHAAGDALLHRMGARLAITAEEHFGSAFRMGGDEFCVLARCHADAAERLLDATISSLTETGDGWRVSCSQGAAWIPSEAATESQALRLADERMYANKASRSSASRQVSDALLQVVTEQGAQLDEHVERVSELAGRLAEHVGEPAHEISRIRLAGRLHDIGKAATPAGILDKPEHELDERERAFVRHHPAIGERIVLSAPALATTAPIIRSSHERIDGHGYPDGLAGDAIPLGSRIIAICDAFDAMTSERPGRPAMSVDAALEELKLCAGTQFDGTLVEEFANDASLRALLTRGT